KVGYTAPSVEGQAQVIAAAQAMAGVTADTISYVEAHGTGTSLGDPIEIAALTQAFRKTSQGRQYCAVGSLKSNLGHLDAAAGVAYTLQVGRTARKVRQVLLCEDREQAVGALRGEDSRRVWSGAPENGNRPVIFLFPGQGTQYVNMGRELYEQEGVYRQEVER